MTFTTACSRGTRPLLPTVAHKVSRSCYAWPRAVLRTRVNDTRVDAPAGTLDKLLAAFWEVGSASRPHLPTQSTV